jgi:pimeloyl-ACP methyl ester carboxylesterase
MAEMTAPSSQKSTIVRFFRPSLPLRIAFPLLERAAPTIGASWAEKLWFTLPKRRLETRLSGQPVSVGLNRRRVRGQQWGHGPIVYLMHGWAGAGVQFEPFVGPLVKAGYQVVAIDAPSHGRSDPGHFGRDSSTIPEFTEALVAMVEELGPAHAIVAHSMGASAAVGALADGLTTERLVMLAPMASPLTYAEQFGAALGFGPRTFGRLIQRVEARVGAPMHHFDLPELGRAIEMPPALIVHDLDDATTPVADSHEIAAAWRSVRLMVTSGLGHRRILKDPDVIEAVVKYIDA